MLSYGHTFVLDQIIREKAGRSLNEADHELVLGNIMPDLATDRIDYQPIAHDLEALLTKQPISDFLIGAIIHVLTDNYTILGRGRFTGHYRHVPKNGFVSVTAYQFQKTYQTELTKLKKYNIPPRRFIHCGLEFLLFQECRQFLSDRLHTAERFLHHHQAEMIEKYTQLYPQIPQELLLKGINRYHFVYGINGPGISDDWRRRLFPIARAIIQHKNGHRKNYFTDPDQVMQTINAHSEIVDLVLKAARLIQDQWKEYLWQTSRAVLGIEMVDSYFESDKILTRRSKFKIDHQS